MSGFSGGPGGDPWGFAKYRAATMGYDLQTGPDTVAVEFDEANNKVTVINKQPARQIVTENDRFASTQPENFIP